MWSFIRSTECLKQPPCCHVSCPQGWAQDARVTLGANACDRLSAFVDLTCCPSPAAHKHGRAHSPTHMHVHTRAYSHAPSHPCTLTLAHTHANLILMHAHTRAHLLPQNHRQRTLLQPHPDACGCPLWPHCFVAVNLCSRCFLLLGGQGLLSLSPRKSPVPPSRQHQTQGLAHLRVSVTAFWKREKLKHCLRWDIPQASPPPTYLE